MNTNSTSTTPADLDQQLTVVEQQARSLADTTPAVDAIAAGLDHLYQAGANNDTLIAIQDGAQTLLDALDGQQQAFRSALDLAQQIRAQRDQTRKTLEELRDAISNANTDVPEIAELYESLGEQAQEETFEWLMEIMQDEVIEMIVDNTDLGYHEAYHLFILLTEEGLPEESDHPLWGDLRAWLARAKQVRDES